ncbi:trichohyalin [Trichogramma pretiosum]|uniref:trichohyalin n=1 Tax=Trichogramma pretiosum TaxID=7493 RepID=UPI000C719D54|nr:trichohyalin [Trichogramma pretiosum]
MANARCCVSYGRRRSNGCGSSAKPPSKPATYISLFGLDKASEIAERVTTSERELAQFMAFEQVNRLREKKVIARNIKERVKLGLEAYEEDIEERRDRLRELLLREEAEQTRELVDLFRLKEKQRIAELAEKAAAEEREREQARQTLLKEKKLQRYVESSQEVRKGRSQAWLEDAKRINLVQIDEAAKIRRLKRNEDQYWHTLEESLRTVALEREAKNTAKKQEYTRQVTEELKRQMEQARKMKSLKSGLLASEETPPFYQRQGDKSAEELKNREQKLKMREDLDKQLAEAKRKLEAQIQQEEVLERYEASFGVIKPSVDKETRRREMLAYMQDLQEFRKIISQRDVEVENCIKQLAIEADNQCIEKALRKKEEEAMKNQKLAATWKCQHEEKVKKEQLENQIIRSEGRELTDDDIRREERLRRRQGAKKYGLELRSQYEQSKVERERKERIEREREALRLAELEREENFFKEALATKLNACT